MKYIDEFDVIDPFDEEDWGEKETDYIIKSEFPITINQACNIVKQIAKKGNAVTITKYMTHIYYNLASIIIQTNQHIITYHNVDSSWKEIFKQTFKAMTGQNHIKEFEIYFSDSKSMNNFLNRCKIDLKKIS